MARRKHPKRSAGARGPDARALAYRMLAEGGTLTDIAAELGVERHAVRKWRDSVEGQEYLRKLRAEREKQYEKIAEDARRGLRELALRAVSVLQDRMESEVPFEAVTAAKEVLDRVGVMRGEVLHIGGQADFSKLTDEEFAALEAAHQKVTT